MISMNLDQGFYVKGLFKLMLTLQNNLTPLSFSLTRKAEAKCPVSELKLLLETNFGRNEKLRSQTKI